MFKQLQKQRGDIKPINEKEMEIIVVRNVRKDDKENFRTACKRTKQTMSGYLKKCIYDKIRELSYLDRVK